MFLSKKTVQKVELKHVGIKIGQQFRGKTEQFCLEDRGFDS